MLLLCCLCACSTKKNTALTRSFHQMQTKYNIFHNGAISFAEGEQAIIEANQDDFSTILPLYPVSNHEAAKAAVSQMDRTIEKCRKCIKLHSIKARPKVNYDKKRNNPKYAAWLEQEEFNNQLGKAWMLLAQAEFHKGEFLGSISTFNYITRHYSNDVDMVAQCQLWIARAYAEMGWLYEAEDILNKVQLDNLSRKNAPLYAAVSADIMIKTKQYKEAIPFIKLAIPEEDKHMYRPRFQFVLGQLYQLQGERKLALDAYRKVLKLQPSNEMDFNARLHIAELDPSTKDAIKLLNKMTKLDKNKDLLDQIYGTIANIYLAQRDTAQALAFYEKAIESSTQNGLAKANVLIIAGDIYYEQRNYIKASPCYKEATQILSAESEQYARIQKRSETLDELVVEYSVVQLQDSLQALAKLSPEQQRVVVDSIIARLIREEEIAREKEAQAERAAANASGPRSVNTSNMLGGAGASREWYFYNPQLMRTGQQTFRTQWGNRTLEDNWRRLSKTATSTDENSTEELATDTLDGTSNTTTAATPIETDNHKPEFYLQQIPKNEADIALSNEQIATALYNMVYIYRDRVGDQELSDETFLEFCQRFPKHPLLVDLYYMQYLTALKTNDAAAAQQYRQSILQLFPDSKEAQIVSQPDYFNQLRRMSVEQDSLYEQTYNAYCQSLFEQVKTNTSYAKTNYPLSPLMPRFLFLNAIATAKTDGQDAFIQQLREMVGQYPDSELSSMAKDMLALMGQGAESQVGDMASLQAKRQVENNSLVEDSTVITFDATRNAPALVILLIQQDETKLNQLLYDVALFNFSQFMIKDFDLEKELNFTTTQSAIIISGFEKMDEADWYTNLLKKNPEIGQQIIDNQIQVLSITLSNYDLIGKQFTIADYIEWLTTNP